MYMSILIQNLSEHHVHQFLLFSVSK
jgi:hypothetical protein